MVKKDGQVDKIYHMNLCSDVLFQLSIDAFCSLKRGSLKCLSVNV